ncbi:hypothetical protein ABK905_06080 [Acerihabitans sp. KWT182]|uniref:Uncharacterized protein n=1 Tax=Acerihabitans sp. KWT182 TaxID=3157919 RepID=A0AAU7QBZ2_9GAMM
MTTPKTTAPVEQKPEDVTVSEGLAKILEADALLTPEQEDAMADKARAAAKESRDAHNKHQDE